MCDSWYPDSIQASLKLNFLSVLNHSSRSVNRGVQEKGGMTEEFCTVLSCECKHFIFASSQITNMPMLMFAQDVIQLLRLVCGLLVTPQPASTAYVFGSYPWSGTGSSLCGCLWMLQVVLQRGEGKVTIIHCIPKGLPFCRVGKRTQVLPDPGSALKD